MIWFLFQVLVGMLAIPLTVFFSVKLGTSAYLIARARFEDDYDLGDDNGTTRTT